MASVPIDDLGESQARALLRAHFGVEPGALEPLTGGFFSRAFGCDIGGSGYVIRLNHAAHAAEGFAKDEFAAQHFAGPRVPIPRILARGATEDGAFAIGERAAGRSLEEHSPDERRALLPEILDTLDAIARADVGVSLGFGHWGANGDAPFATWHAYLAAIAENETHGYHRDWHALFHESFLERELYDTVYRRMLHLAERVPERRGLIHNDYWYMNIIAGGRRITGVIDWANALYGDPLYDVARLAWGSAWPDWWFPDGEELLRARYGAAPGYAERIACYQLHLGLDDLRFYARTRRRPEYDLYRARLLARCADRSLD